MKVAFIRQKFDPFGGAERYTQGILAYLANRGTEIHLLARSWKSESSFRFIFHKIRGPSAPSWLRHRCFVTRVQHHLAHSDYDLIQSGERIPGCHIYRAGDGVHARWLEIRRQQGGYRQRLSIALNPFHHLVCRLERQMYKDSRLRAVIVNSEMVRNEIRAFFKIDNEKIHTIYNGVDLDCYHPGLRATLGRELRQSHHVDDQEVVVLFIGSGYERKGLTTLIQAIAAVKNKVKLWVVGKGKKAKFQQLARRLSLSERITFFGAQSDVKRFYAAADIFALPTRYDPFPSAALEAMAMGLPTIVSRNCGVAEIIVNHQEGFVLEVIDDSIQLSEFIDALCDGDKRADMSVKARRRAENFPIKQALAANEDLYKSLLA